MLFFLVVWPFLIPVVAALYMSWLAWTKGGDPEEDSATVQYEPPENLTPAECDALLNKAVSPRGITATIVDLSIKGYFAIEPQDESKTTGLEDNRDYTFHLIRPASGWNILKPHERAVMNAIFFPNNPLRMLSDAMSRLQKASANRARGGTFLGMEVLPIAKVQEILTADPRIRAIAEAEGEARSEVTLSKSRNFFYLHKAELSAYVFDALIAGGYYAKRPDSMRLFYMNAAIMMGLLVALVGRFLAAPATPWLTWILSGVLTGLIVAGFGSFMPARTIAGVRALGKVRGFADFLGRVEKDQIQRVEKTPQLFEKCLPFAMALGVENQWAQSFGRINIQPKWHRGSDDDFLPMELVSNLSAMPHQTGIAMAPADSAT